MVDKSSQPPDKPAAKKRKSANVKSPKQETPPAVSAVSAVSGEVKQSCAECRRMKIKCDRVFPCKTCVKRGLEGICPEGSLVTGRGTRYVLASTEELHGKIERMAERIRSLEEALGALHREHAACPTSPPSYPDTHPLLQGEVLQVKGQLDLYGIEPSRSQSADVETTLAENREPMSDPCGRRPSRDNGNAFDTSGRPPSLNDSDIDPSLLDTKRKHMMDVDETETDGRTPNNRQQFLRSLVKFPKDETLRLYGVAVRNFGWVLNCPEQPGYILGFIEKIYDQLSPLEPQQVALVLAILATGARLDNDAECRKYDVHSNTPSLDMAGSRLTLGLYRNAKMALASSPVQSKPDYCSLFAVYAMTWYLALLTDFKDAGRQAWIMIRLAVKMAITLGLNREVTYKSIPANERFEHRLLFWSIVHLESRLELLGGRTVGLTRSQIDCDEPLASSYGAPQVFSSRFEAIYNDYKLRFMDDVTIPVVAAIANARNTRLRSKEYNGLLDLDARIRDYPIPAILSNWFYHAGAAPFRRRPTYTKAYSLDNYGKDETSRLNEIPDCPPHVSTLIRCIVFQQMAMSLLQLHLPYAHCHCRDHRTVTQRRFMPSAIAAFSASVSIIDSTKKLYDAEPALATRVSGFWYNTFCSATWLFVLVVMKPFCPVAVLAIQELEKIRNLFCVASRDCYMAARSFPILREFYAKAKKVYDRWSDATSPLYDLLPVKVPDQALFGSSGEVILCQNRLDIIVKEIQRVPGSASEDEAAATAGLLDLNRAPHTFEERTSFTLDGRRVSTLHKLDHVPEKTAGAPSMDIDEPPSPDMDDETFYDMWSHAHEEICDFVRRAPDVLRDAQVDPRRATAARLVWGIIPEKPTNLEELESAEKREAVRLEKLDVLNLDSRPRRNQISHELDWDAITDALMNVSPATSSTASLSTSTSTISPSISPSISTMPSNGSFGPGKFGQGILLTPPSSENSGSPIDGNATAFPMLEACAPIDAMYEPMDVSNVDIDAMDNAFESYAMDGASNGSMVWPRYTPSGKRDKHDQEKTQAMAAQLKQIKSVDRCSYGNPVARNETVGGVFEHFGRSPYLSY